MAGRPNGAPPQHPSWGLVLCNFSTLVRRVKEVDSLSTETVNSTGGNPNGNHRHPVKQGMTRSSDLESSCHQRPHRSNPQKTISIPTLP